MLRWRWESSFAAVNVAARAKCAVTLLHSGVVYQDRRVVQRLAGCVCNRASERRPVGGE
jgi:hypothetical protein